MKPAPVGRQHAFTLLELSISLLIIALVTGMAVTAGVGLIATSRQSATQNKMNVIEQALMQFRTANDRLPCPADITFTPNLSSTNYGVEAANPGVCTGGTPAANNSAAGATNTFATGVEGALPAVSLGLPLDFMVDGWGNKFRYAVDASMTANAAFVTTPAGCIDGALTINDANGNARSSNSIYALISSGANGHGAYTRSNVIVNAGSTNANEQTNCHCNSTATATTYAPTYVQMAPYVDSATATDTFDDLVTYKERWQMQTPWDSKGGCQYIYVAEYSNYRVSVFNLNGTFINGIGAGYNGVAGTIGSGGPGNGQLRNPQGIAIDSSGNIWVVDAGNSRVQKLTSNGSYLMQVGCGGSGHCAASSANGMLANPQGVAIDSSGNIWEVDYDNQRVQEFNSAGTWLRSIGGPPASTCVTIPSGTVPACPAGAAPGQFNHPVSVVIDSNSNVWVTDFTNARVQEFNSSGTYLNALSSGHLTGPWGITIDASGNFWVADRGSETIQEFNSSGVYLNTFDGANGSANGQFMQETDIAIDPSGNLWVTDGTNQRVQKFNSTGTYLSQLGCATGACSSGLGNGQFNVPGFIAISGR
jgi:prepilin-type N-terminal cleavage/methylation domain-containing protein